MSGIEGIMIKILSDLGLKISCQSNNNPDIIIKLVIFKYTNI